MQNEYHISNNEVREAIRSALVLLNTYRDNIDHKIIKIFDKSRNITPKYFLDTFVTYLKFKIRNNFKVIQNYFLFFLFI